jgi:hypothetical protein
MPAAQFRDPMILFIEVKAGNWVFHDVNPLGIHFRFRTPLLENPTYLLLAFFSFFFWRFSFNVVSDFFFTAFLAS